MTSRQVVEMSVNVITNSPSQDYTHPDSHNSLTYNLSFCAQLHEKLTSKLNHVLGLQDQYKFSIVCFLQREELSNESDKDA